MSDRTTNILDSSSLVLIVLISLFGVGNNIVNLHIFKRMGFKESINVSFFGLSLFDLLFCVVLGAFAVCETTWVQTAFLGHDIHPSMIKAVPATAVHTFHMMTPLLTTFIALEQCLCVVYPLSIKHLLTPKKVKVVIVSMLAFSIVRVFPVGFTNLEWVNDPDLNTTFLALDIASEVFRIISTTDSVLLLILTVISIACSCTLIFQVRKWSVSVMRGSRPSAQKALQSFRSKRVVKTVTLITLLHAVCAIPEVCSLLASVFIPGFTFGGEHHTWFFWVWRVVNVFYAMNAASNIFIYYTVSANYKSKFKDIFQIKLR